MAVLNQLLQFLDSNQLFDQEDTLFVEVLLPLNLNKSFTYRVPRSLSSEISAGQRVAVPFGKNKLFAGIVLKIGNIPPKEYTAKYIIEIIDNEAVVLPYQLEFWQWISSYYMCSLGQVMNAALPAGLKLEGESKVLLHPDFSWEMNTWDSLEQLILQLLEANHELTISKLTQLSKKNSIHKHLKSLYTKGAVLIKEDLQTKFKSKKEKYLQIHEAYRSDEKMNHVFSELEKRAFKQVEVLMSILSKYGWSAKFPQKELLKTGSSKSALAALIEKGIIQMEEVEVSRLNKLKSEDTDLDLSEAQKEAMVEIQSAFDQNKPVLLHGITSSGKTLIYTQLIQEELEQGNQVLYLLPEIALTSQLLDRLANYFGEHMVVTHSKFSMNERVEVHYKVLEGEPLLILGTRSSLFQPFNGLSLIIIDEEHESSFKQFEPAPRFHARDAALYLSKMLETNVLLGSATPSIESYYNSEQNKYHRVELLSRYDNAKLPDIEIVDMLEQKKQKRNRGIFSDTLLDALIRTKAEGKQSILFQNRKGYVPVLECTDCGWTPQCINCDISLTYYKYQNNLRCHYCGYTRETVTKCAACGNNSLELIGYGTERIEDELSDFAPELRTQRLDYNSTKHKNSHKKIITAFAKGKIDVLIGTQMVAKGLDFDNVKVVGIVNADHLLNFPDFRAYERSFQLMTQVAGRAGRREEQGIVYIQSSKAAHTTLDQIKNADYTSFYSDELSERQNFNYPPFSRLIRVTLKHKDALVLHKAAQHAKNEFNGIFGNSMLGPEKPHVGKIRNWYLLHFLLKIDLEGMSLSKTKKQLKHTLDQLEQDELMKGIRFTVDVDPY